MNANSIPASAWMLLEILGSPPLESRVRTELAAALVSPNILSTNPSATANDANTIPIYDVPKLCASPLLQSLYAETLRLRVAIIGTRLVTSPTLSLSSWHFQRGDVLAYASPLSALDATVWNTGSGSSSEGEPPHPLTAFWADRFLVYPNDRDSGPLLRHGNGRVKKTRVGQGATSQDINGQRDDSKKKEEERSQPQFSLEGLAASWIPYGGGLRLCPGRHFAKQEMLVSTAVWLGAYEIELVPGQKFVVDKDYFGFGTMPPKGKIAARIRRRRRGN